MKDAFHDKTVEARSEILIIVCKRKLGNHFKDDTSIPRCRFQPRQLEMSCLHLENTLTKKGKHIVTRVTSGNKWSGQSVKNSFNPPEVHHNPQWHLSGGWSIWEMTALCASDAQILRDEACPETGDSPLSQWEVWMSSCQSTHLGALKSLSRFQTER